MNLLIINFIIFSYISILSLTDDMLVDVHDEGGVKHIYNIKVSKESIEKSQLNEKYQSIDTILNDKTHSIEKTTPMEKPSSKHEMVHDKYEEAFTNSLLYTNSISTASLIQKHEFLTGYSNILNPLIESLWVPSEVSPDCYDKVTKLKQPYGLCNEKLYSALPYNEKGFQNYASFIVDGNKLPHATGRKTLNYKIAHAIVLLNTGHVDSSIKELTQLVKHHPSLPVLFYVRSVAYLRKNVTIFAKRALEDVDKALKLETMEAQPYERKTGILALMGHYREGLPFADKAIAFNPSWRNYNQRAILNFILENWSRAEKDLRKVLSISENNIIAMYNLGIVLIHKGRYRNAASIFIDILQLDPSHFNSLIIVAEIYKAIGDAAKSLDYFSKAITINPSNKILTEIYKSRAELHYNTGDLKSAIKESEKCIELDAKNSGCLYIQSLSLSTMGQFYEGIKTAIKVIVQESFESNRLLSLNPEYIKAQYLKEWDRYIHSHLENDISYLNVSMDFPPDYRDKWMKTIPLDFVPDYTEKMGLQPHIADVRETSYSDYSKEVQALLCHVKKRSRLYSTEMDGSYNNMRVNFALSLGSVHVSQAIKEYWHSLINSRNNTSSQHLRKPTWNNLLNAIVLYVSLADPQQPPLWLETLPNERLQDGYTSEKIIIRGDEENLQLMPYFNLVFQLVKTMVEYMKQDKSETKVDVTLNGNKATVSSTGNGFNSASILQEIRSANDCSQLLQAAKKKGATANSGGVFVSTQVPSTKKKKNHQLEGEIIFLSEDSYQQPILGLNVLLTKDRLNSYNEELTFIFDSFLNEALHIHKRSVTSSNALTEDEVAPLVDRSLSFLYYVSNARPLSHSTSLVGYSFTIGMLMALGFDIQGKIPPAKTLDMEPLLAGTPDAFIVVAKKWLKMRLSSNQTAPLPQIRQSLSSVRVVMEILALSSTLQCS